MKRIIILILISNFALPQNWFTNFFSSEKSIVEISDIASPSVVSIGNVDYKDKVISEGSGFIVRKDGTIVTNFHVIKGAHKILVRLKNNTVYEATGVIDFDIEEDFAIIKIDANNLPVISIGESVKLKVGSKTVAIGNPYGLNHTVSDGIISQIREIDNNTIIQITTPITYGSSGGPLLNLYAEAIGITTSGLEGGGNIGFAIPMHRLKILEKEYLPLKYSIEQFATMSKSNEHQKENQSSVTYRKYLIWYYYLCVFVIIAALDS